MNLSKPLSTTAHLLHSLFRYCRLHLPRQRCVSFVPLSHAQNSGIGPIFVINLDRQTTRWADIRRELASILDSAGRPLSERVVRYSACDAQNDSQGLLNK